MFQVKLKMLMLFKNLAFALIFTQASCYTVIGPKLFSQTIPPSSRGWSNLVPYPFRAYQPSIPVQYYGRYFGDPYFTPNLQNTDYYFTQDPYLSTFDDPDYYSNILYYIPSSRHTSYYDQTIMDPTDDSQDYDDDTSDNNGISKSQREWWLEKDVTPNEDIDVSQLKQIDSFNGKNTKTSKKQKMNPQDIRKLLPSNRYVGIDGFGRKKDKEQIFGNYKSSLRTEQPPWMYGVPIRTDYDDSEVRELKSLLKEPDLDFEDTKVAQWASGNMKRSIQTVMNPENKENSSYKDKFVSALKHVNVIGPFPMYNEGGQEDIKETTMAENNWALDYTTKQPSVFDKIKKLLAFEDEMKRVSQVRIFLLF